MLDRLPLPMGCFRYQRQSHRTATHNNTAALHCGSSLSSSEGDWAFFKKYKWVRLAAAKAV